MAIRVSPESKIRCLDCQLYSEDCGYWDKKYRAAQGQAGFLSETANHGCPDFKRKGINVQIPK